jgi:hypothetical protein
VRYNDVEDIDSDFDTYYEPVVEKIAWTQGDQIFAVWANIKKYVHKILKFL